MSTGPTRVYAARLVGLPIFDPQGDQVGKVRDLVVALRSEINQPRVLGMVAEVFGRRRIFVPMTRVTNIDSGQVYTTGLLNMRRFEQRSTETLVIGQLLDRTVRIPGAGHRHRVRRGDGAGPQPGLGALPGRGPGAGQGAAPPGADPRRRVARRRGAHRSRGDPGGHAPDRGAQRDAAGRRGQHDPRAAGGASCRRRGRPGRRAPGRRPRGAARRGPGGDPRAPRLRAGRRHPRGDVARRRRRPDRRPAARHRRTAAGADGARRGRGRPAADVLRRAHRGRDDDAGAGHPGPGRDHRRRPRPRAQPRPAGLPGRDGVRVPPAARAADRPVPRRRPHPAAAARAPSTLVAGALDNSMDPLRPMASIEQVAAHLATYNLVAAPVVDDNGRLLGAVTVDDLLDHMLPENWREQALRPGDARPRRSRG